MARCVVHGPLGFHTLLAQERHKDPETQGANGPCGQQCTDYISTAVAVICLSVALLCSFLVTSYIEQCIACKLTISNIFPLLSVR